MDNPAAWHPDPSGKHDHRWWDGQRWTEHVADAGVASVDPLPAAPDPGTGGAGPSEHTDAAGSGDTASSDDGAGTATGDAGAATGGATAVGATGAGSGEDVTRPIDPATDPGDTTGTSGASQTAEQPVWEQRPQDAPPAWGGAPQANAPWGQQQPPYGQQPWGPGPGQAAAPSGMAIGALVTGILSLPLLLAFGLGAVLGIVAVVLGIIAVRRANRGEASGRGMAIGGIVTGAISIIFGVVIAIALFAFGMGVVEEMEACLEETGGDQAECNRRLERELTDRFLGD